RWVKYVGENGAPGATPQKGVDYFDGDDGVSSFAYVAYAADAAGTGWSLIPTSLLKFRSEIHSTTPLTPVAGDFAGATWVKYLGDNGNNGRGIVSVLLTGTVGKVKTYTITYTDATTTTFDVTDGADVEGGGGGSGSLDEIIDVYIDFMDDIPYTYTCPVALRFTSMEHEGNEPALSVPLNTDMAKYADVVITPDGPGLVILKGAVASYFVWEVYIDFELAKAETYKCPYALKFTSMEHEQANAPVLSVALDTNMAKYEALTITADAPGLVTLIGILL
ncbi:MAG: hypothetical protein Q8J76_08300, partial [Desulfobulbaceae bacterium]|nr:hypothetical protein [Desulfobulbaceae bacterium]